MAEENVQPVPEQTPEPKVRKDINLFEDMNAHKQNDESYQRMLREQEANKVARPKPRNN